MFSSNGSLVLIMSLCNRPRTTRAKGMFVPLENFFFSLSTPPPEFGEEEWKEQEKKKKPEYNHDDNHRLPFSC